MYNEQSPVKPDLSGHPKEQTKIGFQDRFSLNAGQNYYRMLPLEHSAIISTFINLPFINKIFVLSILEWSLKTGFTVSYQVEESIRIQRVNI